ncbi:MAG: hydroxymyristoyl-ACP dehydratase [Paludibacteraceae bacterium]|nr:hydroxymyristoyl-ACP dehydratase [Paludibacteraceae bacterium]
MKILYSNQQIYDLIPQRPPMLMIDTVLQSDDHAIRTALTIVEDNIFVNDTYMVEAGIIEHIAQTAAALAGYEALSRHIPPQLGYIGEVKNFECQTLPSVGDTIQTRMEIIAKMVNVMLVQASTSMEQKTIATCQMKIFIKDENNRNN